MKFSKAKSSSPQAWEEEQRKQIMHSMSQALNSVAHHCSRREVESWPSHVSRHLGLTASSAMTTSQAGAGSHTYQEEVNSQSEDDLDW